MDKCFYNTQGEMQCNKPNTIEHFGTNDKWSRVNLGYTCADCSMTCGRGWNYSGTCQTAKDSRNRTRYDCYCTRR